MEINDKVTIKTNYGGNYNGKTGSIKYKITDKTNPLNGWYQVKFDKPLIIGNTYFAEDIFKEEELILI